MQMCEALEECDWCPELSPVSAGPRLSSHWSRMFLMVLILASDWWMLTKYSKETPHITAPSFLFTAVVQTDLQHTAECQLYQDYLQLRKLHSKVPACSTAALQHASRNSKCTLYETIDNFSKSPTLLFKCILFNKVNSWFITISFMLTYHLNHNIHKNRKNHHSHSPQPLLQPSFHPEPAVEAAWWAQYLCRPHWHQSLQRAEFQEEPSGEEV